MKLLLTFLSALLLSACAGRIAEPPRFAFSVLYGVKVFCARAVRLPCGVSLSECSTNLQYECVTDVMLLDLTQAAEFQRQLRARALADSI